MNILFMAPQPFYQDRGTPIAIDNVLRLLSERGYHVDVVTYHEGKNINYNHITIYRTLRMPFVRNIRPGFSWKKLICDFLMFLKVTRLVLRKRYELVHAVEESVFIAIVLKVLFNIPYVYDMDSSLNQQLVERHSVLTPFSFLLSFFEGLAVRNAKAVVPVCEALATSIKKHKPEKVVVLPDVSLLKKVELQSVENLRNQLRIRGPLLMYVGNLEVYQGIDLLLASFALACKATALADLVIIGGKVTDIHKYRKQCDWLGIDQNVHFLGPKPVEHLAAYLSQADILVSPRIHGQNTPMKIYSYLDSGKALLATDLPTHTQVVNSRVAMLAKPSPKMFAQGMLRLIEDETLRLELGAAGKKLIEESFSYNVFRQRLDGLFDWLKTEIDQKHTCIAGMDGPVL